MKNEAISWIVESTLADKGEALTWRATEHHIDFGIAKMSSTANVVTRHIDDAHTERVRVGKIIFMGSAVDRVDFHCNGNIESGLFEP